MLERLTKRDAYFLGYANSYQARIDQMKAENGEWSQIVERWPNGTAAEDLRPRIARNEAEIKRLSAKVASILANVRV